MQEFALGINHDYRDVDLKCQYMMQNILIPLEKCMLKNYFYSITIFNKKK